MKLTEYRTHNETYPVQNDDGFIVDTRIQIFHLIPAPVAAAHDALVEAAAWVAHYYGHKDDETSCESCKDNIDKLKQALDTLEVVRDD